MVKERPNWTADFTQLLKALNLCVTVRRMPVPATLTSHAHWSCTWWSMKDGVKCQELSFGGVIEYIAGQMLDEKVRKNVRATRISRQEQAEARENETPPPADPPGHQRPSA